MIEAICPFIATGTRSVYGRPVGQASNILGSDRSIVLPIVDELVFGICRIGRNLYFEFDNVVRAAVCAYYLWECCKGNQAEVRFDLHQLGHAVC